MVGVSATSHLRRNGRSHELQRFRQLRPVVCDGSGSPDACLLTLLVENRVAMIEAVERLREAERVFRQNRELERSNGLIHHIVQPCGLEYEAPKIEGLIARA